MTRELDDLVDLDGLAPSERARLQRVHDLLVAAGPPEELPSALRLPPAAPTGRVLAFVPRTGRAVALAAAAAVAAVCFGTGYLIADQARPSGVSVAQVVSLQGAGARDSFASLRVGAADRSGNLPLELTVRGLPPLAGARARYVLMVWVGGKPSSFVGMFKVGRDGPTTVTFSAPFAVTRATRFVVTEMDPGTRFPGHVVMTSS